MRGKIKKSLNIPSFKFGWGGWYPNGNVQWRVDYESVCVRKNLPVPHLTLAGAVAKLANAIV